MKLKRCNPHIPNIDAISGALITLSLSILKLNSQCEEDARNGMDIWYMGIYRQNFRDNPSYVWHKII